MLGHRLFSHKVFLVTSSSKMFLKPPNSVFLVSYMLIFKYSVVILILLKNEVGGEDFHKRISLLERVL